MRSGFETFGATASGEANTCLSMPLRTKWHGAPGRSSASVRWIQRASVMNASGRSTVKPATTRSAWSCS
jgi:hypothetical protein